MTEKTVEKGLVQVQIVNYMKWDLTVSCIRSIQDQDYNNFRIIVIDNASTNDSIQQIKKCCPTIPIIDSKINLGWGGGQNLGFFYDGFKNQSEFYLTVNSDTVLEKDCLSRLVKTIKDHPGCAIVSPIMYRDFGKTRIDNVGYNLSYKYMIPIDLARLTGNHSRYIEGWTRKVNWTDDVVALMRRHAVMEMCGYDEDYFMYVEMTDMAYRLIGKGYYFVVDYKAVAYHLGKGSSSGEMSKLAVYYKFRNWILFQRKHFSEWHMLYVIFWLLIMYVLFSITLLVNKNGGLIKEIHKAIFWNLKHAF